jgi:hypothetical protein
MRRAPPSPRWRERRLGKTFDVAGNEPVSGEISDSIVGKPQALDGGLAGVAAEMNIAGRRAEVFGHGPEFVGGLGQRRQGLRELCTINAGIRKKLGVRACRQIPRAKRLDVGNEQWNRFERPTAERTA